jgi:hypothetical protein
MKSAEKSKSRTITITTMLSLLLLLFLLLLLVLLFHYWSIKFTIKRKFTPLIKDSILVMYSLICVCVTAKVLVIVTDTSACYSVKNAKVYLALITMKHPYSSINCSYTLSTPLPPPLPPPPPTPLLVT